MIYKNLIRNSWQNQIKIVYTIGFGFVYTDSYKFSYLI